jgi:3-oxoacyl-[acyl-carrier protein] reductase
VDEKARPLHGQVALITGSSRGIGRDIALRLAREGARVVVNHRDSAREADETKAAIAGAGGSAVVVKADVADAGDVERLYRACVDACGRVDILVNNASIMRTASLLEISVEEWDRVMAVNVRGMFLCSRAVLPAMIERRSGVIVNVSSGAAFHGGPGADPSACYAASKAAEVGFTYALAKNVGRHGVRVNCVAPGQIDKQAAAPGAARVNAGTLLGRSGSSEEVSGVVAFLCSPDASFVVGQVICVNGGHYLR